jgi:[protein-PII] uridylyltransferase
VDTRINTSMQPAYGAARLTRTGGDPDRVEQEFLRTGQPGPAQKALTEAMDDAVAEAHLECIAPMSGVAVIAVSGFGRGELFPYSEVELAILHAGLPSDGLNEAVANFLRSLRESGARPNHRVATVEQCLDIRDQNFDFLLKLLDRRFLAGDRGLYEELDGSLPVLFAKNPNKLARHACAAARERHANYENTPYHAEPDASAMPGGYLDTVLIRRLSRLLPASNGQGGEMDGAAAFLSRLLCFLHYRAGENHNVLDAAAWRDLSDCPFAGGKNAEALLEEYFRQARAVYRDVRHAIDAREKESTSLLNAFRERQSRLSNNEFTISRERIYLRNPAALATDGEMVLRLSELAAQHGIELAPETELRLEHARDAIAGFYSSPRPVWPLFRRALALPHAAMAIRALRDADLMSAVLPEWTRIQGHVSAEPERRYTADEFALRAIERTGELTAASDPRRQRFSELLSEVEDVAVMRFALLWHEAGKAARVAATRIGMPAAEREALAFLIEHQLDLSDALRGRDLGDPAVARMLAGRIGTVERLKLLTIFTYAVFAAADSDAMTAWRFDQLWRTYSIVQHELTHELETDRIQELPEGLAACADFIRGLPVRYLRSHSVEGIQAHWRLFLQSRPTGVAVQLERAEDLYQLTVVARDLPFLFASFAGTISSFGLDILKAEAFSNSKGVILDTFVIADPKRTLEMNPPEMERLTDVVRRVALGKTDARRLLRDRARVDLKKRVIAPEVRFDSDASPAATLVEIMAEDRPGLLYSLASAISSSGCNIDVVLIDTKGRRAIDVFYIAHEGRKLDPDLQQALKERLLAVC